jgi:hypothetical protein
MPSKRENYWGPNFFLSGRIFLLDWPNSSAKSWHLVGCLTHLARQAPARGEHIKELGLPCLDELKGVGECALASEPGRKGLLGHEHVGNQLVPKLFQALQNRKKRIFWIMI